MNLDETIAEIGQSIDRYATGRILWDVSAEDPEDEGVPFEMQAGPVSTDGWVAWKVLPSTLKQSDLTEFESKFAINLPTSFRAYILARFHLFHQLRAHHHDQTFLLVNFPSSDPLRPFRECLENWQPLLPRNGYIPIGSWGDDWGPLCLDLDSKTSAFDAPVVWFDHELLMEVPAHSDRFPLLPLAQPLYQSFMQLLDDAFSRQET